MWYDVEGIPLQRQVAVIIYCIILFIHKNQNHVFLYVHFDIYKYTEHVLELYKPGDEGNSWEGSGTELVSRGILWYLYY